MSQIISIEYPDYLANSMRMNKSEFGREIKISGLVKLFELGKISSGTASKVLQLSRIEFLELLAKYNVGFLNVEDLNTGLKVTGTIGILLKAKQLGHITELKPLLFELRTKNVWLSDSFIENALKLANEK